MKVNFQVWVLIIGNLIYLSLMGLLGYYTWTGKVSICFGILLLFVLLLRLPDLFNAYRNASMKNDHSSVNLSIKPIPNSRVTPELIVDILNRENVLSTIRNDLRKVGQIGYREEWRIGLIASGQDVYDPRLFQVPRREGVRRFFEDGNFRATVTNQISLQRKAVLHSAIYFKHNNLAVINGAVRPLGYSKWTYGLETRLNRGEFIDLRNIRMEDDSSFSKHRARLLPDFLREDGFPLRETYLESDPLTTDRGGTIVMDRDKTIVIYPEYFAQRRLVDDEGTLIDLGLDEGIGRGIAFEVEMQPSVSRLLIQRVSARKYQPVVRYRSFPHASDFMLPILDTPMSASGWADVFIDPRGHAKLFISRERTETEWYEMMAKLKQLFYDELARKEYHLLGLTKDKTHLNEYFSKKMAILRNYFIVQDWQMVL